MRETMPRAQNRAGKGSILHIVKTIGFYHLVIIYLWCSHTKLTQWAVKSSSQLCKFNIYNVMLNVPRPPFTLVDEKEPISSDDILSFPLRYSYSMWCTYVIVHVPNNMSPVSAPCQLRVSSHKESVMYSMYRGVNTAQNPIVKHRQSIRAR